MAERRNTISMLIMLQFTLLIIEFLLGMYLNLFVTANFPISMSPSSMSTMLTILPHMAVGIILFIVSVAIVVMAARLKEQRIMTSSVLALIFILLSGLSGYLFAFNSGQDILSFTMAVGFLLTLVIYMIPVSVMMRTSGSHARA